jgi:hypothetical protein
MELITREMPLDYTMVLTSDWHMGPLNCHHEGVAVMVDKVARKRNYFMLTIGDLIDAILPNDKRYAHCSMAFDKTMALTPQAQADQVINYLRPIRKKVCAVGIGNHEFHHINTIDIAGYIADTLEIPYGSVSYKFTATHKGAVQHKFFCTHGRGNLPKGAKDPIQREANRKAALKAKLDGTKHADCILLAMGHTHQLIVVEPTVHKELMLTDNGAELRQQYRYHSAQNEPYIPPECRWYLNTGSFLKLYSPPGMRAISYGEMALYAPAEMGWIEVHVRGGEVASVEKVVA